MNHSLTAPTSASQAATASASAQTTAPGAQQVAQVQVAAVASGNAAQYWIELVAYPAGSARSLWLLVGGSWKRLDNPSPSIQDVVQRAFLGSGSTVRVWYDGGLIVGLVVEGS